MRARIGDLAIARFDPGDDDIKANCKWNEKVCIVTGTGTAGPNGTRYYAFMYWDHGTQNGDITCSDLPPHRLVRVRPKNDNWDGTLASLTLDTVVSC